MSKHTKSYYVFNTRETAELIGVSRKTIWDWRKKGKILSIENHASWFSIEEINRIRQEKELPPLSQIQLDQFLLTGTYREFPNIITGNKNVTLIGFSGPKNVGKTTTAAKVTKELRSMGYDAEKISLADPLYQIVSIITEIPVSQLKDEEYKEKEWTEETSPLPCLVGWRPRELLQKVGTECFRNIIHEDIWIQFAEKSAQRLGKDTAVLDDVRFTNEVESCNIVVGLTRDGVRYTREHVSERGVFPNFYTKLYPQINYTHLAQKILRGMRHDTD